MNDIARVFREAYTGLKDRRIAIYGISQNTEAILNGCAEEFNITGLLDGFRNVGKIYNQKIITLEEAASRGTQIIVIVARAASEKIIFHRIVEFCRTNSINVFDIYGNDLCKKYERETATHNEPAMRNYDFGNNIYGPVAAKFTVWLGQQALGGKYDLVLFLSRDGYPIQKMYEKLRATEPSLPKSVYFLTSRTVCAISTSDDRDNVGYFASFAFNGTPEHLLKYRFFLDDSVIEPFRPDIYENTCNYALSHFSLIEKNAKIHKERYLKYIEKKAPYVLDKTKKIAIVDLVSTGTCQMCLQEITGRDFDGYYFSKLKENYVKKSELVIEPMLNENRNDILEHYFWIEMLSKDPQPPLLCFSGAGNPVLRKDSKSDSLKKAISDVQSEVLRWFERNLESLCPDVGVNSESIKFPIGNINCDLFTHGTIRDEFSGRNIDLKLMTL